MATRSTIAIKKDDGKVESVYCHFDGYPSNNGSILFTNYQDVEKIQALIDLGDMSSLGESIECPEGHSYKNSIKGHTVFYGRDRGEQETKKQTFDNIEAYRNGGGEEYNYLFEDNKWFVNGDELTKEIIDAD